ncbi:MAG: sensor histidine kinase, partial [Bacteroidales bacterium]
ALVKKEMAAKFPELSLTLLDSRFASVADIKQQISKLSQESVLLIGTWRINRSGLYFSRHTLRDLIPEKNTVPTFSLTGLGIGDVAIGGYTPDYKIDTKHITSCLIKLYHQQNDSAFILHTKNHYQFDRRLLKKFGIREYQLPVNSDILDGLEVKLKKYQGYITLSLIAVIFLLLLAGICILAGKRLKVKQKELLIALDKAEQSEKLKSAFLANMSHEIRTPLNAIVGFSELMIQSEDIEEKNKFGDLILHNNDLLLNLVNDLLDLSKIEAGYIDFHFEEINLNHLFESLYNDFRIRNKKSIELRLLIPQEECYVNTDPQRLTQIISNYISNAIKFTDEGSVTLGFNKTNDEVECFVEDTGIGIDDKEFHKVFSRFEKFDSFAQGTGLGLSICKAISDAWNGEVGFYSQQGIGSKFWCKLPSHKNENNL